jgi:hypothetical protein
LSLLILNQSAAAALSSKLPSPGKARERKDEKGQKARKKARLTVATAGQSTPQGVDAAKQFGFPK